MAKLNWDVDGTRKFHAGVSHGVVYPKADGEGYDLSLIHISEPTRH